jgi:hypothetical protein
VKRREDEGKCENNANTNVKPSEGKSNVCGKWLEDAVRCAAMQEVVRWKDRRFHRWPALVPKLR